MASRWLPLSGLVFVVLMLVVQRISHQAGSAPAVQSDRVLLSLLWIMVTSVLVYRRPQEERISEPART